MTLQADHLCLLQEKIIATGIRVVAKDDKLRNALGKLVTQLWKEDRLFVSRAINEQTQGKRIVHHVREAATLDHPLFIEALWEAVKNWEDSVMAGYKIIWSRSKITRE